MKKILLTLILPFVIFSSNAQAANKSDLMLAMAHLAYFETQCKAYGKITTKGYTTINSINSIYGNGAASRDPGAVKAWNDMVNFGPSISCAIIKSTYGKNGFIR